MMNTQFSQHLIDVKYRVLRSILMVSAIALSIVALVNWINQRPLINILMPLAAGLMMIPIYMLASKLKYRRPVKLFFMIFLTNLYLPLAWITSPGSFSAMSFYSVLIVFVGLILSEHFYEFIIPFLGLFEMYALLQYEVLHPDQYALYMPMKDRAFDLSVNFTVVIAVLFMISLIINLHFNTEHQRLFRISITDQLTKVYNRRYLFQKLEETHYLSSISGAHYTLLMIDINHFKQVNDTYGHHAGDLVLSELGSILLASSRRLDVPARYGGDEFILLLPETDHSEAQIVADRINSAFRPLAEKYKDIHLALAIGISDNKDRSIEETIQLADDMLYRNKREVKGSQTINSK